MEESQTRFRVEDFEKVLGAGEHGVVKAHKTRTDVVAKFVRSDAKCYDLEIESGLQNLVARNLGMLVLSSNDEVRIDVPKVLQYFPENVGTEFKCWMVMERVIPPDGLDSLIEVNVDRDQYDQVFAPSSGKHDYILRIMSPDMLATLLNSVGIKGSLYSISKAIGQLYAAANYGAIISPHDVEFVVGRTRDNDPHRMCIWMIDFGMCVPFYSGALNEEEGGWPRDVNNLTADANASIQSLKSDMRGNPTFPKAQDIVLSWPWMIGYASAAQNLIKRDPFLVSLLNILIDHMLEIISIDVFDIVMEDFEVPNLLLEPSINTNTLRRANLAIMTNLPSVQSSRANIRGLFYDSIRSTKTMEEHVDRVMMEIVISRGIITMGMMDLFGQTNPSMVSAALAVWIADQDLPWPPSQAIIETQPAIPPDKQRSLALLLRRRGASIHGTSFPPPTHQRVPTPPPPPIEDYPYSDTESESESESEDDSPISATFQWITT